MVGIESYAWGRRWSGNGKVGVRMYECLQVRDYCAGHTENNLIVAGPCWTTISWDLALRRVYRVLKRAKRSGSTAAVERVDGDHRGARQPCHHQEQKGQRNCRKRKAQISICHGPLPRRVQPRWQISTS